MDMAKLCDMSDSLVISSMASLYLLQVYRETSPLLSRLGIVGIKPDNFVICLYILIVFALTIENTPFISQAVT